MSRRPLLVVGLAAAVALAWASGAGATVMEEVPLERMAREADAIVHGVVTRSGTQMVMREDGLEPQTVTTVRVHAWLKGHGGDSVVVREIGGEHQGGGLRIDGTPTYRAGEEVVLFLERHPTDPDAYRTFAMVQGKFVVIHGVPGVPSMVRRDLDGICFARWADGRMTVQHAQAGPAVELESFLATIRGWAR